MPSQLTIWVDKRSFLPLRMEVRDSRGVIVDRSDVTSVEYDVSIPAATFAYAPPAGVTVASFTGGDGRQTSHGGRDHATNPADEVTLSLTRNVGGLGTSTSYRSEAGSVHQGCPLEALIHGVAVCGLQGCHCSHSCARPRWFEHKDSSMAASGVMHVVRGPNLDKARPVPVDLLRACLSSVIACDPTTNLNVGDRVGSEV